MKDKNLMLFGLDGSKSSLKGLWIFFAIYFGATLFAAVLTPPFYWLAQYIQSVDPNFMGVDMNWLLDKGTEAFFDRIRYVPIVLGLPVMMKMCGLFSLKYIGLNLSLSNLKKFAKTFFVGFLTAAAIFSVQYWNAQKPTPNARLLLLPDTYSLEFSQNGSPQKFAAEVPDIEGEKRSELTLPNGEKIKIFQGRKGRHGPERWLRIDAPANCPIVSAANSKGEKISVSNISKKNGSQSFFKMALYSALGGIIGAFLVALLEEVIFRALIFRSFYTAFGAALAVALSSAFFAYKHFGVPNSIWQNIDGGLLHAEWYTGFVIAYYDTVGVFMTFDPVIFAALTLFGCVLSVLYVQTKVLWGPIGFHTGIVATFMVYRDIFFVNPNPEQKFWFGSAALSDSVLAVAILSLILIFQLILGGGFWRTKAKTST